MRWRLQLTLPAGCFIKCFIVFVQVVLLTRLPTAHKHWLYHKNLRHTYTLCSAASESTCQFLPFSSSCVSSLHSTLKVTSIGVTVSQSHNSAGQTIILHRCSDLSINTLIPLIQYTKHCEQKLGQHILCKVSKF